MRVTAYARTDQGLKRKNNEDAFAINEELGLYVVCDGMGGHAGGEVASDTASKMLVVHLKENRDTLTTGTDDEVAALLVEAVQRATSRIYELGKQLVQYAGMGTTLTALLIRHERGFMAHVGDSRLYLKRNGEVHQLSEDHTYVNELVKSGQLTQEQALRIAGAHAITRAVGLQPSVMVDQFQLDVLCNDTYLICSDGLANYTPQASEVLELLESAPAKDLPDRLVQYALDHGGEDNVTAMVVDVQPGEEKHAEERDRETEITLRVETLRRVAVFDGLTVPERVTCLSYVQLVSFPAGETIVKEGDAGDRFYVVMEGEVSVRHDGQEVTRLGGGDHFGEMAMLSANVRSADVVATKDARLFELTREEFERMMREQSHIGHKLLWNIAHVLSERLAAATDLATLYTKTNGSKG